MAGSWWMIPDVNTVNIVKFGVRVFLVSLFLGYGRDQDATLRELEIRLKVACTLVEGRACILVQILCVLYQIVTVQYCQDLNLLITAKSDDVFLHENCFNEASMSGSRWTGIIACAVQRCVVLGCVVLCCAVLCCVNSISYSISFNFVSMRMIFSFISSKYFCILFFYVTQ